MRNFLCKMVTIVLCLAIASNLTSCGKTTASLTLSAAELSLHVGDSETLTVTDVTQGVSFTSEDAAVAEVTSAGIVTAKKAGTTKITAAVGKHRAECTVLIKDSELIAPSQTTYYTGAESPDLANGKIIVHNPDGTSTNVSLLAGGVSLKTFDASTAGNKDVVLTYGGRDYSYAVTVKDLVFGKNTLKDKDYFYSFPIEEANGTASVTENGIVMDKGENAYGLIKIQVTAPADTYAVVVKVSSETDGQTYEFRFEDDEITSNADKRPKAMSKWYKGKDPVPALHAKGGTTANAKAGSYTGAYRFTMDADVEGDLGWNANNAPFLEKLKSGAMTTMTFSYEGAAGEFTVEEVYFINQTEYETENAMELTAPTKWEYVVGETIDLSGGSLTLANVFGNEFKTVALSDSAVTVSGFDSSIKAENQAVTVRYGNLSKTFNVTIKDGYESVTLNAPANSNYQGAAVPYFEGGSLTCVKGNGDKETVLLTDSGVTVKTFDSTTIGVPAQNNVILSFAGEEYGYKSEIISRTASSANNIINAKYLTNFGISALINAEITLSGDKLNIDYGDGKTYGGVKLSVTAPADTFAVYIKASSETDGKVFNFSFKHTELTKNCNYQSNWFKTTWGTGVTETPSLHATDGMKSNAKKGTFEGAMRFQMPTNKEGPLGWNADILPYLTKLQNGEALDIEIISDGAAGTLVIESLYFMTETEYNAFYGLV